MSYLSYQQKTTKEQIMSFLPDDYQAPKSANQSYFKPEDGENKIRILSAPILGWEDWNDKTPVRYKFAFKPDKSIDPKKPVRHFWAFIIWNYKTEQIMIYHVVQASIRNKIEKLTKDSDWGAPYFYDIKIIKTGQQKDTDYDVNPLPHKELHPYIQEQFNAKRCNLEALFTNQDPFDLNWQHYTPGVFSAEQAPKQDATKTHIDAQQKDFLTRLIFSDTNADEAKKLVLTACKCATIDEIKVERYDAAIKWLKERLDNQKAEAGNDSDLPF